MFLARAIEGVREERLENYLVRHLVDYPQIDYDAQADLLFKLAGQMVGRLGTYLPDNDAIENVLLVHGKDLARFIFEQMKAHMWETPTDYEARVARGFQLLKPQAFNVARAGSIRNFRMPVTPVGDTRKFVFDGFSKCCYPRQRFSVGTGAGVCRPDRQRQRTLGGALDQAGRSPIPDRIRQRTRI